MADSIKEPFWLKKEEENFPIGAVVRFEDLSPDIRSQSGLVVLETKDLTKVCPVFQFNKDEQNGSISLDPFIATGWSILTALQIDQIGDSSWSTATLFLQPRVELNGLSWARALKDPKISHRDKLGIYAEMLYDAGHAASWLGIDLQNPLRTLPK